MARVLKLNEKRENLCQTPTLCFTGISFIECAAKQTSQFSSDMCAWHDDNVQHHRAGQVANRESGPIGQQKKSVLALIILMD